MEKDGYYSGFAYDWQALLRQGLAALAARIDAAIAAHGG